MTKAFDHFNRSSAPLAWAAALAAASLLVPPAALALDPSRSLSQYACRNWTRANGLPVSVINAVAQTRDGFIWLGTEK